MAVFHAHEQVRIEATLCNLLEWRRNSAPLYSPRIRAVCSTKSLRLSEERTENGQFSPLEALHFCGMRSRNLVAATFASSARCSANTAVAAGKNRPQCSPLLTHDASASNAIVPGSACSLELLRGAIRASCRAFTFGLRFFFDLKVHSEKTP